jgi:hypothetical protein
MGPEIYATGITWVVALLICSYLKSISKKGQKQALSPLV